MREIKFRAWNPKRKVMNFFDLFTMLLHGHGWCYAFEEHGSVGYPIDIKDGRPIMQYTGLKDKNGAVYCQDDIVLVDEKKYRLILGTFSFELLGKDAYPGQFFNEGYFAKAEIIGNIHENPELLNSEEEETGNN